MSTRERQAAQAHRVAQRVAFKAVGEGYEFWKQDGLRSLKAAAIVLLAAGLSEDDAAEVIGTVWNAAAEEFGA